MSRRQTRVTRAGVRRRLPFSSSRKGERRRPPEPALSRAARCRAPRPARVRPARDPGVPPAIAGVCSRTAAPSRTGSTHPACGQPASRRTAPAPQPRALGQRRSTTPQPIYLNTPQTARKTGETAPRRTGIGQPRTTGLDGHGQHGQHGNAHEVASNGALLNCSPFGVVCVLGGRFNSVFSVLSVAVHSPVGPCSCSRRPSFPIVRGRFCVNCGGR